MVSVWVGLAGGQTNSKSGWGAGWDRDLGEGNGSAFSPPPPASRLGLPDKVPSGCCLSHNLAKAVQRSSGQKSRPRAEGQAPSTPLPASTGAGHRRGSRGPPCRAPPTHSRLLRGLRTPAAWPWLEAAPRPQERCQERAGQASEKGRTSTLTAPGVRPALTSPST